MAFVIRENNCNPLRKIYVQPMEPSEVNRATVSWLKERGRLWKNAPKLRIESFPAPQFRCQMAAGDTTVGSTPTKDFQPDKFDRRELNRRLRALTKIVRCGDDLQDSGHYHRRRRLPRDARDRLRGANRFEASDTRPALVLLQPSDEFLFFLGHSISSASRLPTPAAFTSVFMTSDIFVCSLRILWCCLDFVLG
jgi:hypothetical protein